jgi:hypothetical protein
MFIVLFFFIVLSGRRYGIYTVFILYPGAVYGYTALPQVTLDDHLTIGIRVIFLSVNISASSRLQVENSEITAPSDPP